MAWNQPGGNGGRDPWGNRGDQQGPPDLDEVLRKLQAQLGRIFGAKGGGGGGGLGRIGGLGGGGAMGLGIVLVGAIVAWFLSGIFIVEPAEQGVVLRFGKYVRTVEPGPHWAPRFIESVEQVDVQQVREENIGFLRQGGSKSVVARESLMLTKDENIIDIQFSVQYRISDPALFLFRVAQPSLTLRQVTESAVREIVGRSGMDFVITGGRDAVAVEVQVLIQEILDRYETGLRVTSVNMQDAQPPQQVRDAFFDAIKAREDQQRIINEANAYKADVVPKSRGEATAILERSEGYRQRIIAQAVGESDRFLKVLEEYRKAPEITRERLFIDAVEQVMVNSSKVLVDVQGGNNLMYLPLDRLIGRGDGSGSPGSQRAESSGLGAQGPSFDASRRSRDSLSGRTR
jgi:membrane protease subunit HflK